jgi:hypothetical protein
VKAVFGLIEHYRVGAVHYLVGDLLAAMGGETVHHQCVAARPLQEALVHLVRLENTGALLGLGLLPFMLCAMLPLR